MKILTLNEIITCELFSQDKTYLAADLCHMVYSKSGSGPSAESIMSELLAEAVLEIRTLRRLATTLETEREERQHI